MLVPAEFVIIYQFWPLSKLELAVEAIKLVIGWHTTILSVKIKNKSFLLNVQSKMQIQYHYSTVIALQ